MIGSADEDKKKTTPKNINTISFVNANSCKVRFFPL